MRALEVRNAIECTIGTEPSLLAVGPEGVWVTTFEDGVNQAVRLDPVTLAQTARVAISSYPQGMVLRDDGLWILQMNLENVFGVDTDVLDLTQIDRQSGEVIRAVRLPFNASHSSDDQPHLASTDDALWVTVSNTAVLARIRASDAETIAQVHLPGRPQMLAARGGTVWVDVADDATAKSRILAFDAATNALSADIACGCFDLARATKLVATDQDVWIGGSAIVHIDSATRKVAGRLNKLVSALSTDGRAVWLVGPITIPKHGSMADDARHAPNGLILRLRSGSLEPAAGIVVKLGYQEFFGSLNASDAHTLWLVKADYCCSAGKFTLVRLTLA